MPDEEALITFGKNVKNFSVESASWPVSTNIKVQQRTSRHKEGTEVDFEFSLYNRIK